MSELEEVVRTVSDLVVSSARWNTAGVILLAITAVIAVATAVVSGVALSKQERLRDAESRLASLKEKQLRDELTEAGNTAKEARDRSVMLETEAAKQQERAAKAEKELLELQQRLAWRTFTKEEEQRLVKELTAFSGMVAELTLLGDDEAARFGETIISILGNAGWSVRIVTTGVSVPPRYGIIIGHANGDNGAETFVRLLKSTNMQVREEIGGKSIQVFVGLKPPP
ncbi:MAG: hypothetical protein HY313_07155 [Acidobacteria bacterium]|nr:hypothetical protein [Acidobacteriota bacterium]